MIRLRNCIAAKSDRKILLLAERRYSCFRFAMIPWARDWIFEAVFFGRTTALIFSSLPTRISASGWAGNWPRVWGPSWTTFQTQWPSSLRSQGGGMWWAAYPCSYDGNIWVCSTSRSAKASSCDYQNGCRPTAVSHDPSVPWSQQTCILHSPVQTSCLACYGSIAHSRCGCRLGLHCS